MKPFHPRNPFQVLGLMLVLFAGTVLFAAVPSAQAGPFGDRPRGGPGGEMRASPLNLRQQGPFDSRGRETRMTSPAERPQRSPRFRDGEARSARPGIRTPGPSPRVGTPPPARPGIRTPGPSSRVGTAPPPRPPVATPRFREYRDARYDHNRLYPVRGQFRTALPHDHWSVLHHGIRFFFSGGVWYLPQGLRFIVTMPPIGLVVPFLPSSYVTVWVGGAPYYYANEVYYAHRGDGYVVVEPPKGEVSRSTPADRLFIYPRLGQSEAQQAEDREACHGWAVEQTGYDPRQPAGEADEASNGEKRSDYSRAMSACLDGRGYTVK